MHDVSQKSVPPSFSASAKRVAGWTAKGVLTAIVLIVGVSFGREVLIWWKSDEAPPIRLPSADALGDLETPHSIRFGDAGWSLGHRTVEGDREEAAAQLRADCRELLQSIKPRPSVAPESGELAIFPVSGASDGRGFIDSLANIEPADREPGKWRIYEYAETPPMAVAVTDSDEPRPIVWAIAVPSGERLWSLCLFSPTDSAVKNIAGNVMPPLPPDSRRTMSIEAVGGEAITAFTGPYEPERWRESFDRWFAERNWRPSASWRKIGKAWHIKYVSPDPADFAAEVRFGPDSRGGLTGLLMITPLRPK